MNFEEAEPLGNPAQLVQRTAGVGVPAICAFPHACGPDARGLGPKMGLETPPLDMRNERPERQGQLVQIGLARGPQPRHLPVGGGRSI